MRRIPTTPATCIHLVSISYFHLSNLKVPIHTIHSALALNPASFPYPRLVSRSTLSSLSFPFAPLFRLPSDHLPLFLNLLPSFINPLPPFLNPLPLFLNFLPLFLSYPQPGPPPLFPASPPPPLPTFSSTSISISSPSTFSSFTDTYSSSSNPSSLLPYNPSPSDFPSISFIISFPFISSSSSISLIFLISFLLVSASLVLLSPL